MPSGYTGFTRQLLCIHHRAYDNPRQLSADTRLTLRLLFVHPEVTLESPWLTLVSLEVTLTDTRKTLGLISVHSELALYSPSLTQLCLLVYSCATLPLQYVHPSLGKRWTMICPGRPAADGCRSGIIPRTSSWSSATARL